jgi:hypothetical protein
MRAEHVKEYLAQEGISIKALRAGKKVLFVDTGFNGTIPRVISEYFPNELKKQLQTHLMVSNDPAQPLSRVFLTALNPMTAKTSPRALHNTIVSYEHLPHFTDRSSGYESVNGRWEPLSPVGGASDGAVSKDVARAYMQDLLSYANESETQALMAERRGLWRKLYRIFSDSSALPVAMRSDVAKTKLKAMLGAHLNDPFVEAMVRDFIEIARTNHDFGIHLAFKDIDLPDEVRISGTLGNKNALIKQNPEWAPILEDPETWIPKLIQAKEWGTLGAISDVITDVEFKRILAKALVPVAQAPDGKSFIKSLVASGDPEFIRQLSRHTFSSPRTAGMRDILGLAIEKADSEGIFNIATYVFSEPHTAGMEDLLKKVIEKAEPHTLESLARNVFSKPHAAQMSDALKLLVERADPKTRESLARYVFSDPAFAREKPLSPDIPIKTSRITPRLKPGDTVRTQAGRQLSIEAFVDEGKRGLVFRANDLETHQLFALKIAKNRDPETLASLAKEAEKDQLYKKHGIAHAAVVESQPTYVLKDFVEGVRADQWLQQWSAKGFPKNSIQIRKLKSLIKSSAQKGIYIRDLNSKNLIWNGKDWIVIDSGGITGDLSSNDSVGRYLEKVESWKSGNARRSQCPMLVETLRNLLK